MKKFFVLAALAGGVAALRYARRRGRPAPQLDPAEPTTVTDLVEQSAHVGYDTQFTPVVNGNVSCGRCGAVAHASRFAMEALRRMEGASDPDDSVAVVAVKCPTCSARGTLVLSHGPVASPEDADVLAALSDNRATSTTSAGLSPGEEKA